MASLGTTILVFIGAGFQASGERLMHNAAREHVPTKRAHGVRSPLDG